MNVCEIEECTGCGACEQACPVHAIKMVEHTKQWFIPKIEEKLCINCGKCQKVCHINSYKKNAKQFDEAYAVCSIDEKLRLSSSSGAFVPTLAKCVFEQAGAVVGAIFDSNQHLHEDIAYSWEEYCEKGFSRSKYVQSETGDIFNRIQEYLKRKNTPLLFVGTPCQNAALATFLGKQYDNLIKIDFVCHGVPSPGVFASYCKYLEDKYHSKIKKVDFRVKKPSWSLSSTVYEFENGIKYAGNMMDDLYNACFANNNNNIRESCYECKYSCKERTSDITACDYWGHREVKLTDNDDEYGVSAIIINTEKGKKIFEVIKENMLWKPISYDSITLANTRLKDPVLNHPKSEAFWKEYLSGKPWSELSEYCESYLTGVSKKTAFLMRHGNDKWVKLIRCVIRKIRRRG